MTCPWKRPVTGCCVGGNERRSFIYYIKIFGVLNGIQLLNTYFLTLFDDQTLGLFSFHQYTHVLTMLLYTDFIFFLFSRSLFPFTISMMKETVNRKMYCNEIHVHFKYFFQCHVLGHWVISVLPDYEFLYTGLL
jgi:hypothetical protein